MQITAADVMKLRKMTSAGMMDCKKALAEAEGDFEKAVEIIREKGKLVAAKRADRETTEGAVLVRIKDGKALSFALVARQTSYQLLLISRTLQHLSLMQPSRHFLLTWRLSNQLS